MRYVRFGLRSKSWQAFEVNYLLLIQDRSQMKLFGKNSYYKPTEEDGLDCKFDTKKKINSTPSVSQ